MGYAYHIELMRGGGAAVSRPGSCTEHGEGTLPLQRCVASVAVRAVGVGRVEGQAGRDCLHPHVRGTGRCWFGRGASTSIGGYAGVLPLACATAALNMEGRYRRR